MRIDETSQQLKEALERNAARVIIKTLQKFPVVAKLAAEAASNGASQALVGRRFAKGNAFTRGTSLLPARLLARLEGQATAGLFTGPAWETI